jgi:hypothetical protein
MPELSNIPHERGPDSVRPFGRYGTGVLNESPTGLLVVAAVILLTLEAIPESRWFLAAALVVGSAIGFVLWLRHR